MNTTPNIEAIDVRSKDIVPTINWKEVLILVTVLSVAVFSLGAMAQSGAGNIQGTVTDPSGAVIPGASIHVLNQATGVTSDSKTNGTGDYQVPGLFAGTYQITVTAPGMASSERTLQLLAGQNASVNFSLKTGSMAQKVEVSANSVQLITTTSGTLSSVLDNSRINQLPMNGREITTLIGETTPGLTGHYGPGTIANGLLEDSSIEYVVDGVPLLNLNFGGPNSTTLSQYPDPDTIQEVHTETSNSNAAYEAPATGVMSTKSGTNSLHGSAFETMRNNTVGIARNRSNPSNFVAPPYIRNEFGASAGGPIRIPHLYNGIDKSFWFFAYERFSLVSKSYESAYVPTVAMRNGDFSGLVNGNGVLQQLYDPATTYDSGSASCPGTPVTAKNPNGANPYCRSPLGNGITGDPGDNQIPMSRLDQTTKLLYAMTPLPTNDADPLVASNLTVKNPTVQIVPTITFRVDHSFSDKDKAFIRYTSNDQTWIGLRNYPSNSPATLAAGGIPAGASGYQSINAAQFAAALNYTHVFSPTFFSETTAAQQWFYQYVGGGGADASPDTNYETKFFGLPNNFGETGFPVICGGTPHCLMPFGGTQYQYYENQIVFNYDENLTKIVGKHQFHFGGRYRRERLSYLPSRQNDSVNFDATGTSEEDPSSGTSYNGLANTGETEADFFLGDASLYSVTLEPPQGHGHVMEWDGYFQDDYHVARNLTLNLGIRNTFVPGFWTKDGLMTTFDFKNNKFVMTNPTSYYIAHGYTTQAIITNLQNLGVNFETSADAGFPSTNAENKNIIQPRVGFAWQPFGNRFGTVVRGGYGKYSFPTALRYSWEDGFAGFPYVQNYAQNYNSAAQSPDGMNNYLVRNPQSVFMGANDQNVVNSSTTTAVVPGFGITALSPNYPPDVAQETNFTIEQPLSGNSAVRLSYVWTHGSDLDQTYSANQALSPYVWDMSTGTPVPTGGASAIGTSQYTATALNPYNNITYGAMNYFGKTGYSNDNALQVNYQRLNHNGFGYQFIYVYQKAFTGDGTVYTPQDYLGVRGTNANTTVAALPGSSAITPGATPPSSPAGQPSWQTWRGLTNFEDYQVNAGNPKQEIEFNGIVDLPFGRGKRFFGNANGLLNEIIGGFQLAGDGTIAGQYFQPIATHWGPTNKIKVYKHGLPIKDCRSGVCIASYEWFNGYLAPTVLPAPLGTCTSKCVEGLPADWVPFVTPINNNPADSSDYGNDNVLVSSPALLASNKGQPVKVAYSPGQAGNNPFSHTVLPGPINWTADLSLYKVFPITERVSLRFNLDAFNAFNAQGYNNPSTTDGTEPVQPGAPGVSSHNTPRQVQLTARLTF